MTIINKNLAIVEASPEVTDLNRIEAIDKQNAMLRRLVQGPWSMLVMGEPGTGKTETVINVLKENNIECAGIKGVGSPIGLYRFAYENNGKTLIIDDSDPLLGNVEATEILKAMTDSKKKRKVSWVKQNQNLKAIGIPNEYIFTGRIIIITNLALAVTPGGNLTKEQKLMKPVVDRLPIMAMGMPNRHWQVLNLQVMHERDEIVYFNEQSKNSVIVPANIRQEMINFVAANQDYFSNISFRTVVKMVDFWKEDPINWKDLTMLTVA